jgi:beta-glucanase (GH16 family)
MGATIGPTSSRIGYGLHPWSDPTIRDEFHEDSVPIDATEFHVYAAEWTPQRVDFYVDNRMTRSIPQSPQYPMQFMLGIYERPSVAKPGDPVGGPYPKTFTVDYFRAYQPVGGY